MGAAALHCDLLVVGSGAAGLAAAVTAAHHGLKVVLVEKDAVFGGATAWSGGWLWVPGNPLARRAGIHEDPQQPRTYLRHALGPRYDAERVDAFLDHAGAMVAFFEQHTALQFVDGNAIPDMHQQLPGAATQGHQVAAAPCDGRSLGPLIQQLRSGYLQRGASIEALAGACRIDPAGLAATLRAFNAGARRGEDSAFGRGSSAYNRKQGDPLHGPNPCVVPIEHGPFYAVKVLPGSFGTFAGLKTNGRAQVLGADGGPIAGLYAAGRLAPTPSPTAS